MLFISPHGSIDVFHSAISFSLVYVGNRGAAWGVMNDFHLVLLAARILLTLGLIAYLIFKNNDKRRIIPFIMIIAGAMGNILDCFLYGHVVDMLKFVFWNYHYPIFNIADSSICIGVLWLLVLSFFEKNTNASSPHEEEEEPYRSSL